MSVYVISDGENVKVGVSVDVYQRFSSIQTGNAKKLTLIGFVDGEADLEKEIHSRLCEFHIRGEWYKWTPESQSILSSLGFPVKPAPPSVRTIAEYLRGIAWRGPASVVDGCVAEKRRAKAARKADVSAARAALISDRALARRVTGMNQGHPETEPIRQRYRAQIEPATRAYQAEIYPFEKAYNEAYDREEDLPDDQRTDTDRADEDLQVARQLFLEQFHRETRAYREEYDQSMEPFCREYERMKDEIQQKYDQAKNDAESECRKVFHQVDDFFREYLEDLDKDLRRHYSMRDVYVKPP